MSDAKVVFLSAKSPEEFYHLHRGALLRRQTSIFGHNLCGAKEAKVDHATSGSLFDDVPAAQAAVTFHTSGSTGAPKPVTRSWGHLVGDSTAISESLGITAAEGLRTISSVPLDHMFGYSYGFVLTNMLGFERPKTQPVFPHSLLAELKASDQPAMLVTTPMHLNAYISSGIAEFPNVERIFSATSPTSPHLNAQVYARFGVHITDIYGCTEAGTLAFKDWRVTETDWTCLNGISLSDDRDGMAFNAAYFDETVRTDDLLKPIGDNQFEFLGRSSERLKIGGKRQSLSGLNALVNALDCVTDAAFYFPEDSENARLCLFVQYSGQPEPDAILTHLRTKVDPLFLPRSIIALKALPRTATGKLPLSSLKTLHSDLILTKRGQRA